MNRTVAIVYRLREEESRLRSRLCRYLGFEPDAVRHVRPWGVPPCSWEAERGARLNAMGIAWNFLSQPEAPRFFLVGRLVINAFSDPRQYYAYGTIMFVHDVPAIALPGLYDSDPDQQEEVPRWVESFRRCFCC